MLNINVNFRLERKLIFQDYEGKGKLMIRVVLESELIKTLINVYIAFRDSFLIRV